MAAEHQCAASPSATAPISINSLNRRDLKA